MHDNSLRIVQTVHKHMCTQILKVDHYVFAPCSISKLFLHRSTDVRTTNEPGGMQLDTTVSKLYLLQHMQYIEQNEARI